MTTDAAETEALAADAPGPVYHGYVVLEWPAPVKTLTFSQAMVAWEVGIFDACEGTAIVTAEKITVRASADNWVVADLTMLADPDGMPILNGSTVYPDGEGGFLKGEFSFLVAEMRVRS